MRIDWIRKYTLRTFGGDLTMPQHRAEAQDVLKLQPGKRGGQLRVRPAQIRKRGRQ
jgi:hypothetical protein